MGKAFNTILEFGKPEKGIEDGPGFCDPVRKSGFRAGLRIKKNLTLRRSIFLS